jgi:hypothetical protein
MDESPADRFRRLQRSLDETGEWDDEEPETAEGEESSSEPAESGGGDHEPLKLSGRPERGPAPAENREPPSSDAGQAAEPPDDSEWIESLPPQEPVKPPQVPHWRTRRRIRLGGPPPSGSQGPGGTSGFARRRKSRARAFRSCLFRSGLAVVFALTAILFLAAGFMLYEYFQIAATLPPVEDLRERTAQFETARIYDRNGDLLYEILDPNAGRRTYTPLSKISPYIPDSIFGGSCARSRRTFPRGRPFREPPPSPNSWRGWF